MLIPVLMMSFMWRICLVIWGCGGEEGDRWRGWVRRLVLNTEIEGVDGLEDAFEGFILEV